MPRVPREPTPVAALGGLLATHRWLATGAARGARSTQAPGRPALPPGAAALRPPRRAGARPTPHLNTGEVARRHPQETKRERPCPLPEVLYGRRKMTAWLARNGFPDGQTRRRPGARHEAPARSAPPTVELRAHLGPRRVARQRPPPLQALPTRRIRDRVTMTQYTSVLPVGERAHVFRDYPQVLAVARLREAQGVASKPRQRGGQRGRCAPAWGAGAVKAHSSWLPSS
jgi:hypothetical protein